MLEKYKKRIRRHKRVRAKIFGTASRPRLCVFRSKKHIYTQLIDDEKGKTLAAASDLQLKFKTKKEKGKTIAPDIAFGSVKGGRVTKKLKSSKEETVRKGKVAVAYEVGKLIAKKALEKKIEKVVFDRGGYKYHGKVKAISEGAREGGLKF